MHHKGAETLKVFYLNELVFFFLPFFYGVGFVMLEGEKAVGQ